MLEEQRYRGVSIPGVSDAQDRETGTNSQETKLKGKWGGKKKEEILGLFCDNSDFFHSGPAFLRFEQDSVFEESEDEVYDAPIQTIEGKTLDEYLDLNEQEKKFFKMWNNFFREFEKAQKKKTKEAAYAFVENMRMGLRKPEDFKEVKEIGCQNLDYVEICKAFIDQNIGELKSMRENFALHINTLFIFKLMDSNGMFELLCYYEDMMPEDAKNAERELMIIRDEDTEMGEEIGRVIE